jgi:hypothetical protein
VHTFTLDTTDQSGNKVTDRLTYTINWGDGSRLQQVTATASTPVSHVYGDDGTWSFTVALPATPAAAPFCISVAVGVAG